MECTKRFWIKAKQIEDCLFQNTYYGIKKYMGVIGVQSWKAAQCAYANFENSSGTQEELRHEMNFEKH